MLEILLLLIAAVVLFLLTKTFFRVILYLVVYNLLAALAYLTIGTLLNLDAPGIFLLSRVFFIVAAFRIGNRIWEFVSRHQLVNIIILLLFAWMIYRLAIDPPRQYYYHQLPESNYSNYI